MQTKKFGTFQGVFVPSVLTILGIILFLRLPWVVGNAGVGGAIIIILISVAITLFTTLSLSSIVSNIRIGAGGAFSIIARSLGLEIGGSIGIPLYLSQAVAVAMYIFGFREGWLWLFPDHPPLMIDMAAFTVIFGLAMVSTNLAFKLQYGILVVVLLAIVSIGLGLFVGRSPHVPQLMGEFVKAREGELIGSQFWVVFAIFFPAVTGIMAGLNMSGELENPRKSIPKGTLWAVILTSLIYIGLVLVAGFLGDPGELRGNYNFFIEKSYMPQVVLVGILGATFSSALASFVGAPRVLNAIAEKNILPGSRYLKKTNNRGEPYFAIIFTGIIVLCGILMRELNAIAPLITMFFLITYAMINLVVLIEQSLSLPSFRPTFQVPIYIPLFGSLSCFFVMFIVNPTFSMVAIIGVFALYFFFGRRHLAADGGFARSGLFTAMAQWATKKSKNLGKEDEPRAWQPDLLFPITHIQDLRACYKLVYSLIHPKGSLRILAIGKGGDLERLKKHLPNLIDNFEKVKTTIQFSLVESSDFGQSVKIGTEALSAAFFKPNTIFLKVDGATALLEDYGMIMATAREHHWGVLVYAPFARVGLGLEKVVNLWLRDIPDDWEENMELGNNDLAVLSALLIRRNWAGSLNVILEYTGDRQTALQRLVRLKASIRLPKKTKFYAVAADERRKWDQVPQPDLHIVGTPETIDPVEMMEEAKRFRTSFLFAMDSGGENAQV